VIQALKVIPTALKLGGSVKKVLITFGPFGADFLRIQKNLAQFKKAIAGVQAMTDIDGLDLTAAPYEETSFWTNVLKKTNTGGAAGFACGTSSYTAAPTIRTG
jgi:hypothetical protein